MIGFGRGYRLVAAVFCLLIAAATVFAASGARAEDRYPSRPITFVVPFAAGGPTDILARLIAATIGPLLGQQVVVEDVTGAGGTIGATRVARADPDGYTMVMGNLGTHAASLGIYQSLAYDPRTDFEPVILVASTPMVLVTRKTTSSSSGGSCITSPGVSSGRAVSCARHHQMAEPGREPMAGVVLHRAQFGRRAERVGHPLGRALVIGGEAHAHMAIVEDRIVLAVSLLDLVERLRDQEALQAVARHERERALEEIEPAERREFVEHQQQAMPSAASPPGPRSVDGRSG